MKQRTEITLEQRETVILRQSEGHIEEYCLRCQARIRFVTPEILAGLSSVSEREIFRLIEEGQICFVETQRLYACPHCYTRVIENTAFRTARP